MVIANIHLGRLFWLLSQIEAQRNMVGFVVDGHIYIIMQDSLVTKVRPIHFFPNLGALGVNLAHFGTETNYSL